MSLDRILVPVDFSAESIAAFQLALDQFGGRGRALVVLHVVESVSSEVEDDPRAGMRFIDERERKLQALIGARPDAWVSTQIIIVTGKPSEKIVDIAADSKADLVVMGAHGGGGLVEGLFGSTTYTVARRLRCAVLIAK